MMTAVAALPRGRLLTIAEFAALPEDEFHYWELQEGNLVMSPHAVPEHMLAVGELWAQLREQLPEPVVPIIEVDLDLELVPPDHPGTARIPDLLIVERGELDRREREGGFLRATGVHLVVEILSPGSIRLDRIVKLREYADAGIPNYWIVELDPQPTLTAFQLVEAGYEATEPVTGVYQGEPFGVRIDIAALRR